MRDFCVAYAFTAYGVTSYTMAGGTTCAGHVPSWSCVIAGAIISERGNVLVSEDEEYPQYD